MIYRSTFLLLITLYTAGFVCEKDFSVFSAFFIFVFTGIKWLFLININICTHTHIIHAKDMLSCVSNKFLDIIVTAGFKRNEYEYRRKAQYTMCI